jgi:exosortase
MQNPVKMSSKNKTNLIWVALVLTAFILCYAKVIVMLIRVWQHSYIYSYGFLIPCMSSYLIWASRQKLKNISPLPSYLLGIPVLCIGLLMLIIGSAKAIVSIQGFSLIIAIIGVILLILGRTFFSAVWFPVTYLLFMVPFWDRLTTKLHMPLQIFSAFLSSIILQVIGIPVYRENLYLQLPNITLEVAQVCSGVNNLIAVVAIAIPLGYISLKSWSRRIILVITGIFIAILGNGIRVALIATLAYFNIAGDLHGPYHILQAMIVSVIGFIGLFIGAWILSIGEAVHRVSNSDSGICPPDLNCQESNEIKECK